MTQVVEFLLSKHEAVSSHHATTKKKIKNRTTIWPSNSTVGYFGYLSNVNKMSMSKRHLLSHDHCSTIYHSQEMEVILSGHQLVKKVWHKFTMEYYSAVIEMKSCHFQQHGWNCGLLCEVKCARHRKTSTTWSYSYMDSKSWSHSSWESRTLAIRVSVERWGRGYKRLINGL
jgi:hypothetical protein